MTPGSPNTSIDFDWYVLNYIPPTTAKRETAEAVIARFNASMPSPLELFAPTFVKMTEERGKVQVSEKPLLFHYVFLRGPLLEVKRLCSQTNGFSLILGHSSGRQYLTIPDASIRSFRTIARFHAGSIPCLSASTAELEDGDLVEIVDGDFPGLQGHYIPTKRGQSGKLLISVAQGFAAAVYNVKAQYIRVLEFAPGTKRAYDQIEAFVPRLYAAMRLYHTPASLSPSILTPIQLFCRRYGQTRLTNPKLAAKLNILLSAGYKILGNDDQYSQASARLHTLTEHITNPWTIALANLCKAALTPGLQGLAEAASQLPPPSPAESKAHQALRAEYTHYLNILKPASK